MVNVRQSNYILKTSFVKQTRIQQPNYERPWWFVKAASKAFDCAVDVLRMLVNAVENCSGFFFVPLSKEQNPKPQFKKEQKGEASVRYSSWLWLLLLSSSTVVFSVFHCLHVLCCCLTKTIWLLRFYRWCIWYKWSRSTLEKSLQDCMDYPIQHIEGCACHHECKRVNMSNAHRDR